MKEVRAYIKPAMLARVVRALHDVDGLTGLSVTDVRGFGRGRRGDDPAHVVAGEVFQEPHVKLEIFCADGLVDTVVAAIRDHAHTGRRGDGKIYVCPVDDAVRISTGERGEAAL